MRLFRHRRAAAANQYALVVGLIAIGGILAVTALGAGVSFMMSRTANTLTSAGNGTVGSGGGGGAPANQPPVANGQTLGTAGTIGLTRSISLSGLISDPEGQPLTITSLVPTNGQASIAGLSINFTPDAPSSSFVYTVSDGSLTANATVTVTNQNYVGSCNALKTAGQNTDGTYMIDVDGGGALAPFAASCDMNISGGGWTLVLNYLHQGDGVSFSSSSPALNGRTTNLPLLGSSTLGVNEAGSANWGHAVPALLNSISFTNLRFYCATSGHGRVMHFQTAHGSTISYFKTGTGSASGLASNYTTLGGHSANLPGSITNVFSDQGTLAMTNFPFYNGGNYHWGMGAAGSSPRWECDDHLNTNGQHDDFNTLHRVWVK